MEDEIRTFEEKTVEELDADAEELAELQARIQERKGILTGVAEAEARKARATHDARVQTYVRETAVAEAKGDYEAARKARDRFIAG